MTLNNSTPNAPDNNGFFTQLEAFLQAFRANSTAQTTANGLFRHPATNLGANGIGQQVPTVSQNTTAAASSISTRLSGGTSTPSSTPAGGPTSAPAGGGASAHAGGGTPTSSTVGPAASGATTNGPAATGGGRAASPPPTHGGNNNSTGGSPAASPPSSTGGTTNSTSPPATTDEGAIARAANSSTTSVKQTVELWNSWINHQTFTSRELAYQLATNHTFLTLAFVRKTDKKVRVLHTFGKYAAMDTSDPLNDKFIAFRGDRIRNKTPVPVEMQTRWMKIEDTPVVANDVIAAKDNNNEVIKLTNAIKGTVEGTCKVILIPLPWAAWVVKHIPNLPTFHKFVQTELGKEATAVQQAADYITIWIRAAIVGKNMTGDAHKQSALGIDPADIDSGTEEFESWTKRQLAFHLPVFTPTLPPRPNTTTPPPPPVVVQMPQTQLDGIVAAFMSGANTATRMNDSVVPAGTKYNDRQMARLMGFCGLKATERHNLPQVWLDLQTCKNWRDAMTVMENLFRDIPVDDEIDIFWHKELVNDIWTLNLAHSRTPTVTTAH